MKVSLAVNNITIEEFRSVLDAHDWRYSDSDTATAIRKIVRTDRPNATTFREMYNNYCHYHMENNR